MNQHRNSNDGNIRREETAEWYGGGGTQDYM